MSVLLGISSLAINVGRMQAAKTEVQRAVDAAARYGAKGLNDGTAVAKSITAGGDNAIDANGEQSFTITAANVSVGAWDSSTKTFTADASPTNAIKVTATRNFSLFFAAAIGKTQCSITATAIAVNNAAGPNLIGLQSINAKNNASLGYNSSKGNPGGSNVNNTLLMASNGAITFTMNPSINGGIVLGPSGSYNQSSPTPTASATALSFPATESPPFATSGNLSVSGTVHISGGGTVVYTNINFSNNSTLIFDSPTTVYVTGSVNTANGSVIAPASGIPKDLKIRMTSGTGKTFGSTSANDFTVTGLVYAPDVDMSAKNNATLYGSMLFKSIDVKNNLWVYYDTDSGSVVAGVGSTGGSTISMVK